MADILQIVIGICPFAIALGIASAVDPISDKVIKKQNRRNRRLDHRKQARRDMADMNDAYNSLTTQGACL